MNRSNKRKQKAVHKVLCMANKNEALPMPVSSLGFIVKGIVSVVQLCLLLQLRTVLLWMPIYRNSLAHGLRTCARITVLVSTFGFANIPSAAFLIFIVWLIGGACLIGLLLILQTVALTLNWLVWCGLACSRLLRKVRRQRIAFGLVVIGSVSASIL